MTLLGATEVGAGCEIGPHTTIAETRVGDRVTILH